MNHRGAGVLVHPTSLPTPTLGPDAIRFLDLLAASGFSVWQMLPLGPVRKRASPYSPDSAFAGNPELVPISMCTQDIDPAELAEFIEKEKFWLQDYALFTVIGREQKGAPWWQWPRRLRDRESSALSLFSKDHAAAIDHSIREQYRFAKTWTDLRAAAQARGVLLYGDLPMFVVANSADVWARPDEFSLKREGPQAGQADRVAGAPPDAFTEEGQCWNNPVYEWEVMQSRGFDWWQQRLKHECRRFDLLRWDHFRGLSATWEIPSGTDQYPAHAADGSWRDVPGRDLLNSLQKALGQLPLVAENLGVITPEVEALRHHFGLPGMHVLQFAFDSDEHNPHLPDNHEEQGVVYTGTHDNNTTLGWWTNLDEGRKNVVRTFLGLDRVAMPGDLVQVALDSVCRLAMLPMQDLLGLGSEARMNMPGEAEGQWTWAFSWDQVDPGFTRLWRDQLEAAGRRA